MNRNQYYYSVWNGLEMLSWVKITALGTEIEEKYITHIHKVQVKNKSM